MHIIDIMYDIMYVILVQMSVSKIYQKYMILQTQGFLGLGQQKTIRNQKLRLKIHSVEG